MKRQRFRFKFLALLLFGLMAVLALYGGYSVLTNGGRWFASGHNPRLKSQKQLVIPGDILDRDGTVLAATDADGKRVYAEDPALRRALVHVVGDQAGHVRNAVETFQSAYLYGFQASLGERVGDLIHGTARKGDTVRLTVSAELSRVLADAFSSHGGGKLRGAAVVMNWKTGEVLALVSLPTYDPSAENSEVPGGAYLNRATDMLYTPGAAFEPVVWAASLRQDSASPAERLSKAAEAFGFRENFLFRDLVVANAVFPAPVLTEDKLAQLEQGFGGIAVTPMHLCAVTAAIANDGVMMEPRLLLRVTSAAGSGRLAFSSRTERVCVDVSTAAALQQQLLKTAPEGDPSRSAPPLGAWDGRGDRCAWYTGFLKDSAFPYAICVLIENEDTDAAAAVAGDGLDWLLAHPVSSL